MLALSGNSHGSCSRPTLPLQRNNFSNRCDQKLASDSSGLSGGFSGQRAWVRILKKWAPGSYCLELVVACPAAGTSAQFLLVEGSLKANSF
jgi:hypothetical protein